MTLSTALQRAALGWTFFFLLAVPAAFAQTGSVSGTVVDSQTGETLIGVNVVVGATEPGVVGATQLGTTTDLDGRYALRLDPGTYTLIYSYVGYDRQSVEGVEVHAGQVTALDLALAPTSLGLGEVVVQAEAVVNAEAGLLRVQARAPAIMDGISAQQIRRSPDANSGEALRRVTGVTVSNGKFVFVRGMPERYNGTLLNGSPVPSTEPDRRAFSYDLIPSNLLDYVFVAKSATPDLPGDFAGGVLQLNTVDFPETFTAGLSLSSGVNNATAETLLIGPRGSADYLGIDDGTRAMPTALPQANLSSSAFDDQQRAGFGRMFDNGWGLSQREGPVTPNFSASVGGSQEGRFGRIGAIAAGSYRSGYGLTNLVRREMEGGDQMRFDFTGDRNTYNVTWGGIANLSYRPSPLHSVSFKNFYSRTADDEVIRLAGTEFTSVNADQQQTAIRFLSRDVYAGQLIGEHAFQRVGPGGLQVRWDLSRSLSSRDEPDYRRVVYQRYRDAAETEPFRLVIGPTVSIKNGGRFYSEMDEGTWAGSLRASLPLAGVRWTAGASASDTDREFTSRLLAATQARRNFDFDLLTLPLEQVFSPQNFGRLDRPGCESGGRRCEGFLLGESQMGGTDYTAGQQVTSGFLMADAPVRFLTERLRFVGGLRVEQAVQRVESTDFSGDSLSIRVPYLDALPSFNLTYAVDERSNVRFAYSRTLNRPELRELAPFQYFDFELQTTVYGNTDLRRAVINNVDFRVETYPAPGQLLSASVFYKHFQNPIERAVVPGVALNAERTFTNAESAYNVGFELEGRYGLGALAEGLRQSAVLFNYTWVRSEVSVPGTATTLARTGRPLQGQSPYVVNLGLNLVAPGAGTSVSVLYNRLGARVVEVATAHEDDVVEHARDLLDLAVIQPLMGRYELRFTVRDAFGQPQRFYQGQELVRENMSGTSIGFGVSARF